VEKIQKPYFISQTVMPPFGAERRHPGRPPKLAPLPAATAAVAVDSDVARDRVRLSDRLPGREGVDPRVWWLCALGGHVAPSYLARRA
jgi:hypothetical protein